MSATFILYQSIHDADGEQVDAHRWECSDLHDAGHDGDATDFDAINQAGARALGL